MGRLKTPFSVLVDTGGTEVWSLTPWTRTFTMVMKMLTAASVRNHPEDTGNMKAAQTLNFSFIAVCQNGPKTDARRACSSIFCMAALSFPVR